MYKSLKKNLALFSICLFLSTSVSSCYVHKYQVGEGPQKFEETKKKNHYLINGLIPLKRADAKKMAGDAENYELVTKHNGWDIVFMIFTFGIYTPTTTKVIE
jgi:hypothetical protein